MNTLKPYSKLPFYEVLKKGKYKIFDKNDTLLVNDVLTDLRDAVYIVEACNNYPKLEKIKNVIALDSKDYTDNEVIDMIVNILKDEI